MVIGIEFSFFYGPNVSNIVFFSVGFIYNDAEITRAGEGLVAVVCSNKLVSIISTKIA